MLELGGNAFDAAVAGGFVLHVVEPHLNGPGGDLPAIVATAADPAPRVLCGQGPAPAGATRQAFLDMGLDHVPGLRTAGRRGPRRGRRLAAPAARPRHPPPGHRPRAGDRLRPRRPPPAPAGDGDDRAGAELFESDWTTSADLWLPGGPVPRPGELFTNPAYADVLERLVAAGGGRGAPSPQQAEAARQAWGQGFVAEAVDAFRSREWRHSGGEVLPGLVTGADLAAYSRHLGGAGGGRLARRARSRRPACGARGPSLLQVLGLLDELSLELGRRPRPGHGRGRSTRSPRRGSW